MWLKDLFLRKSKEPEEAETIKLENANEWLKSRTEGAIEEERKKLSLMYSRIAEHSERLKTMLDGLENARLRNEKISQKELALMEGNRDFFIKRTRRFIDGMENREGLLGFFRMEFDVFSKSTAKSFYIMREFFNNEAREIAAMIKNIENCSKELESLASASIDLKMRRAESLISEAMRAVEMKENAEKSLAEKNSFLGKEGESLDAARKSFSALFKDEDWKALTELKIQLENEEKNITRLAGELEEKFGALSFSMKKYRKDHIEETILESYIESPVKAVLADENMDIITVLQKMGASIMNGELTLKESKKEKIIRNIENLGKDYLSGFMKEYKTKKEGMERIKGAISSSPAMKRFEELESSVKAREKRITEIKAEISALKITFEKSDPARAVEQLNEAIEKATGIKVVIKF